MRKAEKSKCRYVIIPTTLVWVLLVLPSLLQIFKAKFDAFKYITLIYSYSAC